MWLPALALPLIAGALSWVLCTPPLLYGLLFYAALLSLQMSQMPDETSKLALATVLILVWVYVLTTESRYRLALDLVLVAGNGYVLYRDDE